MTLMTIRRDVTLAEMQEIGSVEVLGAEIIHGPVTAYGLGTLGQPVDPVSAGYFGVNRGSFKMTYPFNEQATVVAGRVKVTEVATGVSAVYGPGDSWVVSKGTMVIWDVESDYCIKHYFAAV